MPLHPNLTEYEQVVTITSDADTYATLTFPALPPIYKRNDDVGVVVRQFGRAVVWFGQMQAPAPIIENPVFVERPTIVFKRVKNPPHAWETTWEYVMAVDAATAAALDVLGAQAWPMDPVITP